jgi:hypothetical protein
MNAPTSYKYVAAWVRLVGTPNTEAHVEYRQLHASQTNAPINAVFQNRSGEWMTYEDMNQHSQIQLDNYMRQHPAKYKPSMSELAALTLVLSLAEDSACDADYDETTSRATRYADAIQCVKDLFGLK